MKEIRVYEDAHRVPTITQRRPPGIHTRHIPHTLWFYLESWKAYTLFEFLRGFSSVCNYVSGCDAA